MPSWRTQLAIVLFALGSWPVSAQSLGDVARGERERRSKLSHHAVVLTDEDLRRDKILQKIPHEAEPASAATANGADAAIGEDLPLGDYARALRQRQAAEPASPPSTAVADSSPESQPIDFSPVTLIPLSGVAEPGHETISLGDFARQVRTERNAAQLVRTHSNPPPAAAPATTAASPSTTGASHSEVAPKAGQQRPTLSVKAASPKLAPSSQPKPHTQLAQQAHPAPSATSARKVAPAQQSPTLTVKAATPKFAPSSQPKPGTQATQQARPAPAPETTAGKESIRVPHGASLWSLARKHLGAGRLWPVLWKANPQIRKPNHILAGQWLRCPVLSDEELANLLREASMKRLMQSRIDSVGVAGPAEKTPVLPPGSAAQLRPAASAMQPGQQARKSLFSHALSR